MDDETTTPVRLEDGDDLDGFVESYDAALVEFYTSGCPKCQAMEPVLGNVARATDVAVGLINPGNDIGLVDRFELRSVPTLVLFEDGEEIARTATGFQGTGEVVAFLDDHLPAPVDAE